MQSVANLLPSVSSAMPSMASAPTPRAALSSTVTRTLWVRMAEIYGGRWTGSYGDNPNEGAALTWAKGLAGLTGEHLAAGINACITCADPWPPTLPEFRLRCLGVPAFAAVRADAGKQDGFTRLVWQYLDGHRYRMASSDMADRLLREAYDQAREHVMRGGALPEAPVAEIEHEVREQVPASREQVQQHLAEIARELHLSDAEVEAMGVAGLMDAGAGAAEAA